MAAVELRSRSATETRVTLVTPERAPLCAVGAEAGTAIAASMLESAASRSCTARQAELRDGGCAATTPSGSPPTASVALPTSRARASPGLPADEHGFLPVDAHGRVDGVPAYTRPGTRARSRSSRAAWRPSRRMPWRRRSRPTSARVAARPFRPVLRGLLLTGGAPLYLRAELDAQGEPAPPRRGVRCTAARSRAARCGGRREGRRSLPRTVPGHRAPGLARATSRSSTARAQRPHGPRDRVARTRSRSRSLVAEEDARLGDYRQAVHALDAAAALSGGVLPSDYAARREAWARIGAGTH